MQKEFNQTNSFETSNQDKIERPELDIRNNGDVIIVSGDAELALKIIAELDLSEAAWVERRKEQYSKDLEKGEEFRPQGVFSVRLENGRVFVQNKNARGDEEYQRQIKSAVEKALGY